jgi:flavodoxin
LRACVIFVSRFGNTEKVARSLETGLKESGIETDCVKALDVAVDTLKQYDLICVGAPTEAFSASRPMKEFLGTLKGIKLSGKYGFAFDTKLDSRLSGSAAKFIEKELDNLGLRMVSPRESAIVFNLKERGAITGARLKEGEEERFEKIGTTFGKALLAGTSLAAAKGGAAPA